MGRVTLLSVLSLQVPGAQPFAAVYTCYSPLHAGILPKCSLGLRGNNRDMAVY